MAGGLGSTTARKLQEHGASLVLLYAPFEASRVPTVLESVFGSQNPNGVLVYECDITSEQSVQDVFSRIEKLDEFPSILINAAGYVSVQPLEDTSAAEALKNFLPNLLGPFITSNAFFKIYQSRKSQLNHDKVPPGRIVSIASQAAHVALDGHGAYCASKAGLIGHTKCMASEWAPRGITANTVSPTVTWTPLAAKAWADEAKKEKHLSQIPTGRFSVPEEIAEAIEFLCRDSSGMINGADIRVDGGFTISR
jgi:NAD(P)-dependent dehydrogenase (short-subunit alcohol dehydrogenase family)